MLSSFETRALHRSSVCGHGADLNVRKVGRETEGRNSRSPDRRGAPVRADGDAACREVRRAMLRPTSRRMWCARSRSR